MITKTIVITSVEMLGVNRETLERETHVVCGFEDETNLINDYCNKNESFVLCSHKTLVTHHKMKMTDRNFVLFRSIEKKKGDFYRNVDFTRIRGIFCDINAKTVYEDGIVIFSDENEKDIPKLLPDGVYLVKILNEQKETACVFMDRETFFNNGTEA